LVRISSNGTLKRWCASPNGYQSPVVVPLMTPLHVTTAISVGSVSSW
jgi:hypothetical protein